MLISRYDSYEPKYNDLPAFESPGSSHIGCSSLQQCCCMPGLCCMGRNQCSCQYKLVAAHRHSALGPAKDWPVPMYYMSSFEKCPHLHSPINDFSTWTASFWDMGFMGRMGRKGVIGIKLCYCNGHNGCDDLIEDDGWSYGKRLGLDWWMV